MGTIVDPVRRDQCKKQESDMENKLYNNLCKFQTVRTIQNRKLDLATVTKEKKIWQIILENCFERK